MKDLCFINYKQQVINTKFEHIVGAVRLVSLNLTPQDLQDFSDSTKAETDWADTADTTNQAGSNTNGNTGSNNASTSHSQADSWSDNSWSTDDTSSKNWSSNDSWADANGSGVDARDGEAEENDELDGNITVGLSYDKLEYHHCSIITVHCDGNLPCSGGILTMDFILVAWFATVGTVMLWLRRPSIYIPTLGFCHVLRF